MSLETTTPGRIQPTNPYVGPRAFAIGEELPNRQDEARELADLVIAERVVLLHSPSGAGKTSLMQAAVMPMLESDGFHPVGPARVDKQPLDKSIHGRIRNRYVYSIALYLLGNPHQSSPELEPLTLEQVLHRAVPPTEKAETESPPVLIVDQFEEILTLDPTDWEAQEQFFADLRAVLTRRRWWLLLAMREDFMGGLDRYLPLIPGHLRTTYRLDFLTPAEARAAVQRPAESQHVEFESDAAELLIDKLARTRVDSPGQKTTWLPTPYVEPFHLQVACRRLWKQVRGARGDYFRSINRDDVEELDLDRALSRYYSDSIADVERRTGVPQARIRQWFETQLITPQQFRSQTMTGPVQDNPAALNELQAAYLIRSDSRSGTTWYELSHDRLVQAVITSNDEWRRKNYMPWQIRAYQWVRNNKPRDLLLSKVELRYAPWYRSRNLTSDERDFLKESDRTAYTEGLLQRHRDITGVIGAIAIIEFLIILYLLIRPF